MDEEFIGGHYIDPTLDRLGKGRADAVVVFHGASDALDSVGAAAVENVDGDALLEAVVATWGGADVVSRAQEIVGARSVWVLTEKDGTVSCAYARGNVVYFAVSLNRDRARAFVHALP